MTAAARVLVVGLGSPDRGDDALGALVAAAVTHDLPAGARGTTLVVDHEDPTALLDLLERGPDAQRPDMLVVVDAVRGAGPPGRVITLDVGPGGSDEAALHRHLDPGPAGTHGFGLAGAVELARVLGRLPARVVVVGVSAEQFEHGTALSPPVAQAIPEAVATVLGLLSPPGAADAVHCDPRASSKRRCRSEANPAPASA